jgi:hypothetical protein
LVTTGRGDHEVHKGHVVALGKTILELSLLNFTQGNKVLISMFNQLCRERVESCIGLWWGKLRVRDHWRDPGVDGRIILKWIFKK